MNDAVTTLTERGQVSVPALIRKQAKLLPGQSLRWEFVSERELRVVIEGPPTRKPSAAAMIGFARQINPGLPETTAEMLALLRVGEVDE